MGNKENGMGLEDIFLISTMKADVGQMKKSLKPLSHPNEDMKGVYKTAEQTKNDIYNKLGKETVEADSPMGEYLRLRMSSIDSTVFAVSMILQGQELLNAAITKFEAGCTDIRRKIEMRSGECAEEAMERLGNSADGYFMKMLLGALDAAVSALGNGADKDAAVQAFADKMESGLSEAEADIEPDEASDDDGEEDD